MLLSCNKAYKIKIKVWIIKVYIELFQEINKIVKYTKLNTTCLK